MAPKRARKKAAAPPPPLPPPAETPSDESEDDDASADSPVRAATPAVKTAPLPSHKDGEEDSSSSEEEEDDDEEKEEEPVRKKQPPPPQDKDTSGSDDDEEKDSSEEEEEEEPVRMKQPPPPQDKDDEEEELVQRPPPQEKEVEAPAPPQKPALKKAKKTAAFQRVWPTEDEVRILEILAAHRNEHGSLPKPKALFGIFAGKLSHPDYSSKELEDKVKNTGTKYKELINKGEVPGNEDDRQTLELAKLVYGGDTSKKAATAAASNGHDESKGFEEMCLLYPYLAEVVKQLEAKYPTSFKRKFGKMEDHKARAMDDKFKRHRAEQIKQDMRLSDLTKQATKALVDILDV